MSSETIVSFAENLLKLEGMVETLVLEGLGVWGKSVRGHFGLLAHIIRLAHYDAPLDTETGMSMLQHYDDTMVSMVVQREVEGLEVHVAVPPGAFAIMAGEQLRLLCIRRAVATNGPVPACLHRVRTSSSNRERFSVLFASRQKDGVAVSALEDLVDAEHPLLFNPLRHDKYTKWCYSDEGMKLEDPLKMFYGVEKVGAMI
ncbi:probable 2-oxoglutarate-dependent dioxygenase AOP1 [Panicum hallii]|uniref:probable 2-oxoglutarate-dependent dioxygenase AOP1 n=1 Tax=Panicum hallii TaxID=206008 RepID=UPI000DF4ED17|nr:probable 2-oxoglutarate-dependent dioxygenase AOP1 [Panicum hallii]